MTREHDSTFARQSEIIKLLKETDKVWHIFDIIDLVNEKVPGTETIAQGMGSIDLERAVMRDIREFFNAGQLVRVGGIKDEERLMENKYVHIDNGNLEGIIKEAHGAHSRCTVSHKEIEKGKSFSPPEFLNKLREHRSLK